MPPPQIRPCPECYSTKISWHSRRSRRCKLVSLTAMFTNFTVKIIGMGTAPFSRRACPGALTNNAFVCEKSRRPGCTSRPRAFAVLLLRLRAFYKVALPIASAAGRFHFCMVTGIYPSFHLRFRCAAAPLLAVALLFLGGCTQVAGVVVYQDSHVPAKGAIVSVGEPQSGFSYQPHRVDGAGHFSFYIDPLDNSDIWVIPPHGDPTLDAIHLQPSQVNSHMYVVLPNQ